LDSIKLNPTEYNLKVLIKDNELTECIVLVKEEA
jgi:hypothetical protein